VGPCMERKENREAVKGWTGGERRALQDCKTNVLVSGLEWGGKGGEDAKHSDLIQQKRGGVPPVTTPPKKHTH